MQKIFAKRHWEHVEEMTGSSGCVELVLGLTCTRLETEMQKIFAIRGVVLQNV